MDQRRALALCGNLLKDRIHTKPKLGLVLGSGLGDLADYVEDPVIVHYDEIEFLPVSTAPGHKGRFVFGSLEGVDLVIMQGRIHLYEGYTPQQCVFPIRLMGYLGIESLLLTNAAGACNIDYQVGDFCMLKGHISTFVPSPLIGKNIDELGPRFPDMTEVYDKDLRKKMKKVAEKLEIPLQEGVYMQFTGPAYETPEEIRMAQILGADLVGMSTVIEAIAAKHMGIRLGALSLVTNMAAGLSNNLLSEEEVIEEGKKASHTFEKLIRHLLREM